MADAPTPAEMPDGHVVRVQVFREVLFSKVMSPAEAEALAGTISFEVHEAAGTWRLIQFPSEHGGFARIRARQVVAIEPGPVAQLRQAPPAPVHVHLHLSGEDAREAAGSSGLVPTPLALAGRRQPR